MGSTMFMLVFPFKLILSKFNLCVLQWFGKPDNAWEPEVNLGSTFLLQQFWAEFRGGKSYMKIGQIKQASEAKIRKFFFQSVTVHLL
jgi:hypothetical protein